MCRGGPGDDHAPELFYQFKIKVASTVGRSEAACRQLAVRARRHMRDGRPRFEADRRKRLELAERFFDALKDGDVDRLRDLLAADVLMVGDGGGGVATGSSVMGAGKAARVLAATVPSFAGIGVVVESSEVNGRPGAILRDSEGKVFSTWTLDIADGLVQAIRSVNNPDKLRHLRSRRETPGCRRRAKSSASQLEVVMDCQL